MKKVVYCFRFLILFVAAVSFISITPNFCLASREESVLSEEYQLESEKETLKDKLSLEIGWSYGVFLPGLGANRFPERPSKEFLDTLDMTYSENNSSFFLGAKYLATSKLEVYAGIPFALLLQIENNEGGNRRTRGGLTSKWGGVGDIYGGISYALVTESKYRPLVITTVDINSAFSKYTSMGDGFWDITPMLSLRKFISGPIYVKGLAGYTHRLDRKGVDPGEIISYGGGLGFLSGDKNIELDLKRSHAADTKIGDRTVEKSNEDLVMNIAFTSVFGKRTSTFGVFLGGLEEGFNWDKNSVGIFWDFTF